MKEITLSPEQTARIVELIQRYFNEKLDSEIGRFDAEFLLDFFREQIGGYFYNQALADVHSLLHNQMDTMSESIMELERYTPADR